VPGTAWEAGVLAAAGFTLVAPLLVHRELSGLLALAERVGGGAFEAADLELLALMASSVQDCSMRAGLPRRNGAGA